MTDNQAENKAKQIINKIRNIGMVKFIKKVNAELIHELAEQIVPEDQIAYIWNIVCAELAYVKVSY